jgi:hypothetical protein
MNKNDFTVEEENLLCIFDISSRTKLMAGLAAAIQGLDDIEMREIAENALRKLNGLTDADYSTIILSPTYFNDESED